LEERPRANLALLCREMSDCCLAKKKKKKKESNKLFPHHHRDRVAK
jgi:hypothetical protein